jgi:hypothetical protein
MTIPYTGPALDEEAFTCPHCHLYAAMRWVGLVADGAAYELSAKAAICARCDRYSLWHLGTMVYPIAPGVPAPSPGLPRDVADDYREAANVVAASPRAAAALLRAALRRLFADLGETGEANDAVRHLVRRGLNPGVQQSLEVVHVLGPNAVLPGQIDARDDHETAIALFTIVNLIAQTFPSTSSS